MRVQLQLEARRPRGQAPEEGGRAGGGHPGRRGRGRRRGCCLPLARAQDLVPLLLERGGARQGAEAGGPLRPHVVPRGARVRDGRAGRRARLRGGRGGGGGHGARDARGGAPRHEHVDEAARVVKRLDARLLHGEDAAGQRGVAPALERVAGRGEEVGEPAGLVEPVVERDDEGDLARARRRSRSTRGRRRRGSRRPRGASRPCPRSCRRRAPASAAAPPSAGSAPAPSSSRPAPNASRLRFRSRTAVSSAGPVDDSLAEPPATTTARPRAAASSFASADSASAFTPVRPATAANRERARAPAPAARRRRAARAAGPPRARAAAPRPPPRAASRAPAGAGPRSRR